MKRLLFSAAAAAILLTGCGGAESSAPTVATIIPTDSTIKENLEEHGYTVNITDYEGMTMLVTSNGKEPPEFQGLMVMRANSADAIQSQEQESRKVESDNTVIFCRTNDPVYGNIFITGTNDTLRDAGITLGD